LWQLLTANDNETHITGYDDLRFNINEDRFYLATTQQGIHPQHNFMNVLRYFTSRSLRTT